MAKRVLLGIVLLVGLLVLAAVGLRVVLPRLPSSYGYRKEQPNPALPDAIRAMELKPSWQPPRPKAPEAPRWSPEMAAANPPAGSSPSTGESQSRAALGNLPMSHPPAAYGLPLDIQIHNAPEVPKNISEPSPPSAKKAGEKG